MTYSADWNITGEITRLDISGTEKSNRKSSINVIAYMIHRWQPHEWFNYNVDGGVLIASESCNWQWLTEAARRSISASRQQCSRDHIVHSPVQTTLTRVTEWLGGTAAVCCNQSTVKLPFAACRSCRRCSYSDRLVSQPMRYVHFAHIDAIEI